jgi:hypothetical protein
MARSSGISPTVNNFVAVMQSLLTQYDQKLSAKERNPNIYRLAHLIGAGQRVEAELADAGVSGKDTMNPDVAMKFMSALAGVFIVKLDGQFDLPPVRKLVKQIEEFLETGKNPSLIR